MKFELFLLLLVPILTKAEKCDFAQTINITDGLKDSRTNNIIFNNISFTPENYEDYNYIIENSTEIKVEPHTRGCICNIKTCVRICCKSDKIKDLINGKCLDYKYSDKDSKIFVNSTADGDNFDYGELNSEYELIYRKPCQGALVVLEDEESDKWTFWKVRKSF